MSDDEKGEPTASTEVSATSEPQASPEMQETTTLQRQVERFLVGKFGSVNIGHLLLLLLGLHLFAMSFPNSSNAYVFDEAYYVGSSGHFDQNLLQLIPSNLEHPFFGKVWGALGIFLFGDNFFGWRIFYVLIGVASVWALYELALVFFTKENALFAASMLGFETLFFIHTSVALLEGPPILFALLGFLAYFKKHHYLSSVAFGLCLLSKEWGIYFIGALFLYHVWATKNTQLKVLFRGPQLKKLIIFVLILGLVVSLPLWAYDAVYHPYTSTSVIVGTQVVINQQYNSTTTLTTTMTKHSGLITNPVQNFLYYFTYHTGLRFTQQDLASNYWTHEPWMWILPYNVTPSPYYVSHTTVTTTYSNGTTSQTVHTPEDWLGIGNLVIWYSIWLIVPILAIKILRRKVTQLDAMIGSWIAATYLPSFLLYFVFQRTEYSFYFVNVDPGLALGIPMVITMIAQDSTRLQRILMATWFVSALVFFLLYFPIHPLGFT